MRSIRLPFLAPSPRPPHMPKYLEILTGAFSWAVAGLDRPGNRRGRTWLDLGMSRERAEELLRERVYHLDEIQ